MKIISIAARKGGVGKTTTTYLLSTYLVEIKRKRVLLIDADPQSNLSSMFNKEENNTKKLFFKNGFKQVKEIIENTKIKNLDIIGSNIDLDEVNNLILNETIRQRIVAKNLKKHINFLKNNYDYIFVDTNPSLSLVNQNLLIISDEIILIADKGKYSLKGIIDFKADWQMICDDFEIDNNIKTIILNRLQDTSASKQIIEFMDHKFKGIVLESHLNEYATINNAINQKKSLSKDKKLINLGNPIKKIVDELKERNVI